VHRLYQWLSGRASIFRSISSSHMASRTVRTEVTVERQGVSVLLGGGAVGLDACPLCGRRLASEHAPQAGRLPEGSISADDLPVDGASP
jgi:hypothetical protein